LLYLNTIQVIQFRATLAGRSAGLGVGVMLARFWWGSLQGEASAGLGEYGRVILKRIKQIGREGPD